MSNETHGEIPAALMGDMAQDALARSFILRVTIPLLLDAEPVPHILGTATLFKSEGRVFLVTAAHLLHEDGDFSLPTIDFTAIAFPSQPIDASLQTLGSFIILRPAAPSQIDVAVLELQDAETIRQLEIGWGFLGLDQASRSIIGDRYVLSGFPLQSVRLENDCIQQAFLTLYTDALPHAPSVRNPMPGVDRFFYLQNEGFTVDGQSRPIPRLQGLSGASIWSIALPDEKSVWHPSTALQVVAVQSSALRGAWFRGVDWEAVRVILRRPEVGLTNPPV